MKFQNLAKLAVIASLAVGTAASALTIDAISGNLASFGYSVDEMTKMITIRETWDAGTTGNVRLRFTDLGSGDYVVKKYVTNNTGADWTSFGHELLHNDGTPSNDFDGLSFAQGGGIPRTSDTFNALFTDELGSRDYLNWYDGSLDNGTTGFFSYGLRDSGSNNPFLLSQTANVPEPATWALMITGFGMVGYAMRKRTLALTA